MSDSIKYGLLRDGQRLCCNVKLKCADIVRNDDGWLNQIDLDQVIVEFAPGVYFNVTLVAM